MGWVGVTEKKQKQKPYIQNVGKTSWNQVSRLKKKKNQRWEWSIVEVRESKDMSAEKEKFLNTFISDFTEKISVAVQMETKLVKTKGMVRR